MDLVVIGKLGNQNPVIPVVLPLVNKEAKELLDFLVDALGLAICLRVADVTGCSSATRLGISEIRKAWKAQKRRVSGQWLQLTHCACLLS